MSDLNDRDTHMEAAEMNSLGRKSCGCIQKLVDKLTEILKGKLWNLEGAQDFYFILMRSIFLSY